GSGVRPAGRHPPWARARPAITRTLVAAVRFQGISCPATLGHATRPWPVTRAELPQPCLTSVVRIADGRSAHNNRSFARWTLRTAWLECRRNRPTAVLQNGI